ncbi:MAG: rod shape-determining protein RodA, partial [Bacteroidota bacterium]
ISIFAVTYNEKDQVLQSFLELKTDYSRQLLYFGISLLLGIFILLTDSKFFTATSNLFYAFALILLILVFPFHTRVKGTESIIRFGSFQFQPAEFCKIAVNLALAKYLSRLETNFRKTKAHFIAFALALVPAIITIAQHETGLALVYFSFFLVMYREGLPGIYLIIGFSLGVLVIATLVMEKNSLAITLTIIAAAVAYLSRRKIKRNKSVLVIIVGLWLVCVSVQRFAVPFMFKHVLQPYQVERIFNTIGKDVPEDYIKESTVKDDPAKAAKKKEAGDYNVKQSKIAIGSGGFLGKGLLKGTQTRNEFVPEQRTDFIFCTIGEGFGFVGSLIFLSLYLMTLIRIIIIAERQRSTFSRCFAYGLAAVIFFHIVINIGMTVGLMPVIGIPLPLVSYGGTSLLTFSIMFFMLLRFDADRQMVLR